MSGYQDEYRKNWELMFGAKPGQTHVIIGNWEKMRGVAMSEIQRWDFVVGGDCSADGEDICAMYPTKHDGDWIKFTDHAAALRERDQRIAALKKTLKAFYQKTGIIDNGYCAVCRCGHRLWKLPACRVPAGPCSNEECLSRKADALLEAK
jgi:hypothetical protein